MRDGVTNARERGREREVAAALGKVIREAAKDKGYTQDQFADVMGISQSQINRLFNGGQGFRSATLHRLSSILGVPAWALMLEAEGRVDGEV